MDNFFDLNIPFAEIDRVDGKAKVTGKADYVAEHDLPNLTYGVLVGSTIANGTVTAIDTKSAERAPGVLAVITHLNAPKVPGYEEGENPAKGRTGGGGLKIFNDNRIRFNGQPIALVVADTFERATYAASLIKAQYNKEAPHTSLADAIKNDKPIEGDNYKEAVRGEKDAWKTAPVKVEGTYIMPIQVHNPMELHATIARWDGDDKVTVWEKTQGVVSTQQSIANAFKLEQKNVQVYAPYVGGGFGSALRTWPHAIAAVMAAKKLGRPVKLVLTRPQMFMLVGYRPEAIQHISIGATPDGKIVGMRHDAYAVTSNYENFNEGLVAQTKQLYACANLATKYNIYPMNLSTPTWMRGPGEATGSFPLECALDELSYALNLDPIELRKRNYAETDPENGKPYSSKFLREAYDLGAEKFGWKGRKPQPRSMEEDGWLVGYGMSSGMFGAFRGEGRVRLKFSGDGMLTIQSAVSDSGPGTATAMTRIASDAMGLPVNKVNFELGNSAFPPGPTQGGSSTTSTLGTTVSMACDSLKKKLVELLKTQESEIALADVQFAQGEMRLKNGKSISYTDALKAANLPSIELTESSGRNPEMQKYSAYSYSVHFVRVKVHPLTGVVRIDKVVSAGDAGRIISEKTAASQMKGGAVGGIGGALMEEGVIDHRYGRWVNNNFADYHVPVHADVPDVEVVFVNKPDPVLNPNGSKGMGEIALIGFAAAVANAVYHATGKRIRELPITPDKVLL
ncbi:xanthine dehydrogenase family protein molybdopterin-binding subunit [Flavisolibacter nicotianae]|uniref:xanthine dehydrogenase family protein molybdopterin-binding subunit n=1 Tax=Flavisolibacter nicotianae TaxID=2364882 RepID=UPI000EB33839|nr:xanthine dehydrogenase family protein molybdopterin-binding subunit [Flavisolibacter nicotianae]